MNKLHELQCSRAGLRYFQLNALPVQLSIRFMLRSIFAAIRSTFGTSGQQTVSKEGLRSAFCSPYAVLLAPAKMPRIIRMFLRALFCATSTYEAHLTPKLGIFVLCCLLFCLSSPAGACHRPPGGPSHRHSGPFPAPHWGRRVQFFVRRQRMSGTSFGNWRSSSSCCCLLPFGCRSPFLCGVNAFSPNSRPNSRCERAL